MAMLLTALDVQIANWDLMEKLWHQSYYKYLRCDPELHYVPAPLQLACGSCAAVLQTVLTEPPMNDPKNKDYMAEVSPTRYSCPVFQHRQ